MMSGLTLGVLLIQALMPSQDSIEAVRKNARRAEAEFERLARQMAPIKFSSMDGSQCDEIVGRFCLRYDVGEVPAPPDEPSRVVLARRLAIEALRHAFSYYAEELSTSGPLVRYLVEDERAPEAASAARTFAALSRDSIWGPLLVGFAAHAATEDTTAERLFAEAFGRMPAEDRRRIEDVDWLLSAKDGSLYKKLDEESRTQFEASLWTFSDPLFLTPGNERRNQHIARHVWSRVLERAPVVSGMVRWGRDLEELTVRYGIPSGRTRTPGSIGRESSLVEHFDPDQLAYVPEDYLAAGPPLTPPPGSTWALDNPRNRSGYAPATLRKLKALEHQVTRFPDGDSAVIRVDAAAALDSLAAANDSVLTGFWVIEDGSRILRSQTGAVAPFADSVRVWFEAAVPPGDYLYSAEAYESHSRFGLRARYATSIAGVAGRMRLSDPLVAAPFASGRLPLSRRDSALRPHASLVFNAGDTLGLYAEARGLTRAGASARYRVQLSLRRADRASLPARIVSWLGQRIGLASPEVPPRLAWEADTSDPVAVIAVDFPLDRDDSGLYIVALVVTDLGTGESSETTRLIRIVR